MTHRATRWTVRASLFAVATTLVAVAPLAQTAGAPPATGQVPAGTQGRGQAGGRGGGRDVPQAPVVGTGVIAGYVVTEGSGAAVRRARVNLTSPALRGGRSVVTSDDGQFLFTGLPAGRYTMTASKPGYVDISYGAKRAGRPGTPIQLMDGQKLEKAVISLPKGSVITGIVVDDIGEPAPNTTVRAMRFVMRTGEKSLVNAGQATTDDRGMYRIFALQPGDYIVSAVPRNQNVGGVRQMLQAEIEAIARQLETQAVAMGAGGRGGGGGRGGLGRGGGEFILGGGRGGGMMGGRLEELQQQLAEAEEQTAAYAPVYYPGTTTPSGAMTVSLATGDERVGVDFQLRLVQTARIRGTVVAPGGALPQGTQVGLVSIDRGDLPNIPGVGTSTTRVNNQSGEFTFNNIAPGQYRLMARATVREENAAQAPGQQQGRGRGGEGRGRGGQIAQVLWASNDITVSGDNLQDIVLTLQPGMTITGRVQFESAAATPPGDLSRTRVTLQPRGEQLFEMGGGAPPAQVDQAGMFTITGVVPGRYTINANIPGGGGGGRGGGTTPAQPSVSWRLKSALAGGRDVLDFPLELEPNQQVAGLTLTFTDQTQEISGTIQDPTGRPTSDFTIIVFPMDSRYWVPQSRRIQGQRPGTDGRFTLSNLPAGEYRLTAVTDVETGEWYNPDFLQQLLGSSLPITLRDGERKVQDIRVAAGGY